MPPTFAPNTDEKKTTHPASEQAPADLSSQTAGGATAGMPMFLQRSLEQQQVETEDVQETAEAPEAETLLPDIQRKCESCEMEEEESEAISPGLDVVQRQMEDEEPEESSEALQEEPLEESEEPLEEPEEEPLIQPKLTVNPPNDAYEQEADQISDMVVQRTTAPTNGSTSLKRTDSSVIQRECDTCEAEAQANFEEEETAVQRTASSNTAVEYQSLPQTIQPTDAGAPLSSHVRERVEPVLGADLSHVRVHSSPSDRGTARSLHAQAFTHKNHIWLGENKSPDDLKLMAHESAHVVQQTSSSDPVQRLQCKPSDYQYPEDGGGVRARLDSRFSKEIRDSQSEPSNGAAAAEARRSSNTVDRAEMRSRSAELRSETRPDVDRPAQEQPKVEQSASVVEQEAESPPEQLVQGEAQTEPELDQGAGGEATSAAEQAAGLAQQAFAAAASQPEPSPEVEVQPPEPVLPMDAGGEPLEADPEAETAMTDIGDRVQYLRERGTLMRTQATESHANADIIRGNIARVSSEVSKAEEGIATAQEHTQYRHEMIGQAEQALNVSEEKQATVAAQAPDFQSKADEGKEDSGPMVSEAGSLASENASNTPDDSEAAAKSRKQGEKINQVGSDAMTMDSAVSQTRSRADSLAQDAAHAAEMNTQTQGQIGTGQQQLDQTDQRLSQQEAQASQARAQVEGMSSAPDEVHAQATQLDDQGQQLIDSSFELEERLHQTQQNYAAGMQAIPPVEPWQGEMPAASEEGAIQMQEETSQSSDAGAVASTSPATPTIASPPPAVSPPPAASTAVPTASTEEPLSVPESAIATGLEPGAAEPSAEPTTEEEAPPETGAQPEGEAPADAASAAAPDVEAEAAPADTEAALTPTVELGPRQAQVELESDVPPWVTGVDPESVQTHEEARQRVEAERREEIAWFNQQLQGRSVAQIGVGERFNLVRQALQRRFQGIVGHIQWPGWGPVAKMLLDPRWMLASAVSGLGMILSGGANLFSLEQWQRDPLGNLLTSAANIATGLAVILGSITALAGLVAAIMGALMLITFGAAAPIALPVISVCTTIITTVGGWTIAVGKVALVLQALALIKNLIDVATARTADDLQRETEEISGNINGGFQAAMSIVGAKGAQAGLGGLRSRTAGIIRAARRAGGARALAGSLARQAPRLARAAPRALARQALAHAPTLGLTALFASLGAPSEEEVEVASEGVGVDVTPDPAGANGSSTVIQRQPGGVPPTSPPLSYGREFENTVTGMLRRGTVPGLPPFDHVIRGQYNPSGHGIDLIGIRIGENGRVYFYHIEVKGGGMPALGRTRRGTQLGRAWTNNAKDRLLENPRLLNLLRARTGIHDLAILRRRLREAPISVVVHRIANLIRLGPQVGGLLRHGGRRRRPRIRRVGR